MCMPLVLYRWCICKQKEAIRNTMLTLYPPMTHICVMSSHKPIRIYIGVNLILGVNTLYRLFCFFKLFPIGPKLFPMVGKGLSKL